MTKKIVFLTGTRADFGKLKPLINEIEKSKFFDCYVFVTGMHTLSKYGSTFYEVKKEGYENIFIYMNQARDSSMDIILANTITGFSNFVKEIKPDMIVIHGDRVEALAGAIVGSLNNILVAHIEGGEISGTIDELIRHATSKLSHSHFVANEEARKRLVQMGEINKNIFVIGSPDIDIMKSNKLPRIEDAKKRYSIPFSKYAILLYHPVVTEFGNIKRGAEEIVSAVVDSNREYVVIYPNNDTGSEIILEEYKRFEGLDNFKLFPSLKFEFFLTLLKHCEFIIGNSSAGIREAGIYAVPTINIGSRQKNRTKNKDIINVEAKKENIMEAIRTIDNMSIEPVSYFGDGNSAKKFYEIVLDNRLWNINVQKQFSDLKEFN